MTPSIRYAVLGLVALCAVGLAWRGVVIYQADLRAQKAAQLSTVPWGETGQTDGKGVGKESFSQPVAVGDLAGRETTAANLAAAPESRAGAEKRKLVVHVEGAVQKPGVYELEEGARVNDAIQAAGGALADGVPGALNLAEPLVDGAKIYVYTRAELQPAAQPAPTARGATYAPVQTVTAPQPSSPAGGQTGAGVGRQVLVNVNRASAAELELVPGIGPVLARAIVEYRSKHGPFQQIEDLTNVSGIGPKTLEKLRPYLEL